MIRAFLFLAALGLTGCRDEAGGGLSRTRITAVGSSTVFPFTAAIAERFVRTVPDALAPVIESTGTGAGIRLFCNGIGAVHPDIVAASRRMLRSEYRRCREHGAGALIELPVGLDGIAVVEAVGAPPLRLTTADLYRGIAAAPRGTPNAARTWADVNRTLPATPILVYGPPATSGTRDALAELILLPGCLRVEPDVARMTAPARQARCTRLREDGAYVDAGENDNLIVQRIGSDPQALGVLGYGYLRENADAVRGVALDNVPPTYAAIASGRYPGARMLFLYVKVAHLRAVPGLRTFLRLFVASEGPGGPLVRRGLIAASDAVRARAAAVLARETPLDPAVLP